MKVIAHRGASAYALENSREALILAWRQGADWVEMDVRATRDGKLIIMHDPTLDRTTTHCGFVAHFTWAELSQVKLRNGEPLLSLEEALELLQGRVQVYLDIKDNEHKTVFEIARLVCGREGVICGSTETSVLSRLKTLAPEVPTSLLVRELNDPVGKAVQARANYVHLCWEYLADPVGQVTRSLLNKAREAGIGVLLWHEEREGELARIAKLKDVFGFCTSKPDVARRILTGFQSSNQP